MRKAIVLLTILAASTATAEQKNVKLLTGLTDVQLQRTMNLMRGSLGVHCDFCHVVDGPSGWDFASDQKPTKTRAREMIKMVGEINRSTFGGQATVSCYTCHRGSIRPALLVSLPQAPPPFPTPIPKQPELADAKPVLARYAAALGDYSRLTLPRKLTADRITHSIKGDTHTAVEYVESGDATYVKAKDQENKVVEQAVSTEGTWTRDAQGTRALPKSAEENFRALRSAFAPVLPDSLADAKTVGKEKIGERDVWVLASGAERFYFDAASGLLVRKVLLTPTAIGTMPQQTDYDDYRDVGGTKFPFRVTVSLVDPWTGSTRDYSSVELGASVDPSLFKMP